MTLVIQDIEVPGRGLKNMAVRLSRGMFEALTENLSRRFEKCLFDALKRSGLGNRKIDSIWCTGQGSKLFSIQTHLERTFPNVPINTEYSETAVVLGLSKYSGVLSGIVKNGLLLDITPTAVGVKCAWSDSTEWNSFEKVRNNILKEKKGILRLSDKSAENTVTHVLLPIDVTYPTKSKCTAFRLQTSEQPVTLSFVEIDCNGRETPLRDWTLDVSASTFEIVIDMDC